MSIGKSKNKKERKKMNDDMALMWLNQSVTTINATLQLLDIYRHLLLYNILVADMCDAPESLAKKFIYNLCLICKY